MRRRRNRWWRRPDVDLAGPCEPALTAIVEDDHRVGDAIQRLRELLRKGPAEQVRVDVNVVVAGRDATSCRPTRWSGISTSPRSLASTPLLVRGDRMQLAQALLNLIANAMEAVTAVEPSQRA